MIIFYLTIVFNVQTFVKQFWRRVVNSHRDANDTEKHFLAHYFY